MRLRVLFGLIVASLTLPFAAPAQQPPASPPPAAPAAAPSAKPKPPRGGRFQRGAAAPPIAELGESPVTGKKVVVKEGRFGPYITDGETNANVPNGTKPEDIDVDQALSLLAARLEEP